METKERPERKHMNAAELASLVAALPSEERERFEEALQETTFATARNEPTESSNVTASGGPPMPGVSSEVLAEMRATAVGQAIRLRKLYQKWAAEPANPDEPPFEEHMAAINENRRATGERLIY